MEMGRARIRRSRRDKIPRVHTTENGSDEKHIQDRKKRTPIAMKKTWSMGERIFKQDYERRMKM